MHKPHLDLIILDTHNSRNIAVGDASLYPENYNIVSPTLQIKVPGYPEKSIPFTPRAVTLLNSFTLSLTCDETECLKDLPDGLYRFVYSIYPAFEHSVEKFFLKVDRLYQEFDTAYLKTDIIQCDHSIKKQDKELLQRIEFWIQGAIAAANQCNQKLAIDLYQKAAKTLAGFMKARCY